LSPHERPTQKQAWQHSFANEFGRLAQGVGNRIKGTNTIFFIRPYQIPEDRQGDVTYAQICVNYRPQKEEKERTRLTVGGNKINYPGEVSTPMSDTIPHSKSSSTASSRNPTPNA
jgi:hypothetical protein